MTGRTAKWPGLSIIKIWTRTREASIIRENLIMEALHMENLQHYIDWYLTVCAKEKRLSADTLKAYGIDLRQFRDFASGKEVRRELLSGYIQELNRKFSPRSAKRKIASIRAFFKELEYRELIGDNPFENQRCCILGFPYHLIAS